jgi:hypothetical protein
VRLAGIEAVLAIVWPAGTSPGSTGWNGSTRGGSRVVARDSIAGALFAGCRGTRAGTAGAAAGTRAGGAGVAAALTAGASPRSTIAGDRTVAPSSAACRSSRAATLAAPLPAPASGAAPRAALLSCAGHHIEGARRGG